MIRKRPPLKLSVASNNTVTAAAGEGPRPLEMAEHAAIMVCDFDGTIRFWSEGCRRLYGWSAVQAIGLRSGLKTANRVFSKIPDFVDGGWLTDKVLARLRPGEQASDSVAIGLSARRQVSGAVTFALRFRVRGQAKAKVIAIGRWQSPWTPEDARVEATRLLLQAAQGIDPGEAKATAAVAQMTVADLIARYIEAMTSGKLLLRSGKPKAKSTQASDIGRLALHVTPTLGRVVLSELRKADCERLLHQIADGTTTKRSGRKMANSARGGRGAATRVVTLFAAVLAWAVDQNFITASPAKGLRTFAGIKRDRHLDDNEYRAFGRALANPPPGTPPGMLAAVEFTALTGWRMGEVTGLRWDAIDLTRRVANLTSTKTGPSTRPLSQAAIAVLTAQERVPGQALVFAPSRRGQRPSYVFRSAFDKLVRAAGLDATVTPHVLRHSFCSVGGDLELSESSVGGLVGHATSSMTGRYTHRGLPALLAAADRISGKILELMGDDTAPPAVAAPHVDHMRPRPSASRPRLQPAVVGEVAA
jgi:integrase